MTNLVLNGNAIYSVASIADNYNEAELVEAFKTKVLADWLDENGEEDILQSVREIDEKSKNLASALIKALGLDPQLCSKAEKKAKAAQEAIAKHKAEERKAKEEAARRAKEAKEALAKRKAEERKAKEEAARRAKEEKEALAKRKAEERRAKEEAARRAKEAAAKAEAEKARKRREKEQAAKVKRAKERAKEKRMEKLAELDLDELLYRLNSARTNKEYQEINEVYTWKFRNASSWERADHLRRNGGNLGDILEEYGSGTFEKIGKWLFG